MDLRDEGVYTCVATNLAGESRQDVVLKVLGEEVGTKGGASLRALGAAVGVGEGEGVFKS